MNRISAFLKNKQHISASERLSKLLEHPRTKSIRHGPETSFAFEFTEQDDKTTDAQKQHLVKKRYPGLSKLLKKRFYPHYQPPKMRRNEASSKKLGTLIHRHIMHIVHCIPQKQCVCDVKTSVKRINKHAKNILEFFTKQGIKLKEAEIPIVSKRGKFGTRIDLVGIRNENTQYEELTLISIKTGYKKHFSRKLPSGRTMEKPFEMMDDIPLNHHKLQVMTEFMVCHHEYGVTFDEALIVYGAKAKNKDDNKSEELVHIILNQRDLMKDVDKYNQMFS